MKQVNFPNGSLAAEVQAIVMEIKAIFVTGKFNLPITVLLFLYETNYQRTFWQRNGINMLWHMIYVYSKNFLTMYFCHDWGCGNNVHRSILYSRVNVTNRFVLE